MGYRIQRDEKGRRTGQLVRTEIERPVADVPPPTSVTLAGAASEKIECTLCGRRFTTKAIMANHFKKSHSEHWETRESWRDYAKTAR